MHQNLAGSRDTRSVRAFKTVSFEYTSSEKLASVLEDFRMMCNDAIRIAVRVEPKNRLKLIESAYPILSGYGLQTHYILSACEVAYSLYRNKKRKAVPYVKKSFLKLDNQSYRLEHLILRIPAAPRQFIFLTLQGSGYHDSFTSDPSLKMGSVTVTEQRVIISCSKKVEPFNPSGFIGMDTNERDVTVSGTNGWYDQFKELGEIVEIKERYRDIRAKISRIARGDRRIAKELLIKYGKRERNRTVSRLHKVTSEIVDYAKEHKLGIKMEKLMDIRKLYTKVSGRGTSFRARMNSWVFGETQRQVDYKSKWDGVPDWYVNPRGTSSYCLCGSRVVPLAGRKVYCLKCDKLWDRDDLASKRIMACAVPQVRPSKRSDEGERGEDGSNPPSRWREGRGGG